MSNVTQQLPWDLEGSWGEGGFGFKRTARCISGTACSATRGAFGEICFNHLARGYLEVISDPSYAGQIITLTYPQIGNYGVDLQDVQSNKPALRGLVVRDMCATPSNWRSTMTFGECLKRNGVVAIEGVDTRSCRRMRDHGAQRAIISTVDDDAESLLAKVRASKSIVGQNLAATVSCERPCEHTAHDMPDSVRFALAEAPAARFRVIAYDCGVKRSILDGLVRAGCSVTCVPWDTPAEDVLAQHPDGVFLSNGPSDPDAVSGTYSQVRESCLARCRCSASAWAIR